MIRVNRRGSAALAILVGTAAFVVIVGWLHTVDQDVDSIRRGVSRYASGSHGFAVSVAFALLAVSLLMAASQLRGTDALPMALYRRSLGVGTAGLVVVVLFPLRSKSPGAAEYIAHQLGGAVFFVGATIGVQAVPVALRRLAEPAWLTALARWSARMSVLTLLLFFGSVLSGPGLHSVLGILQRCCFIALCTSLITLGSGLLTSPANLALEPSAQAKT